MADNIVDISFTDVTITGNGNTASVTGTIEIDYGEGGGGTVTNVALSVALGEFQIADFTDASTFVVTPNPDGVHFTVSGSDRADSIQFQYASEQPTSLTQLNLAIIAVGIIINAPPGTFDANTLMSSGGCFASGALIRTPSGDVPVESLRIGDIVLTVSGASRPVKWIGHRDFDLRRRLDPRQLFPIRIAAEAFGPNRPSQDLFLSCGHSVCVDLVGEVFIPVGNLINGATIAQIEMDEVTYWHVELDSHDILIANNLPAESYLAMGNRGFFEERRGLLPAMLEGRERTHADFCRPVVLDGPVLAFVRQRLMERAEAIGWTPSRETDLRLMVDGEARRSVEEGDGVTFRFPASASEVRLLSNTFIPALVGCGGDGRELGVAVTALWFSDDKGEPQPVSLDDDRLRGFHAGERKDHAAWRWTTGELVLSQDLWKGLSGTVVLKIRLGTPPVRRWVAPMSEQSEVPSDKSAQPQLHIA